tara:strand:- start:771 stop:2036 length:1266 start_codon:yes stop_codon:yes gene_type:complete
MLKDLLKKGRIITKINSSIYDITDYVEKHPGGDIIKGVGNCNDGTAMFYSSHFNLPNIDTNPYIYKLSVDEDYIININRKFDYDENGFYMSLKNELYSYFKKNNIDYSVPTSSNRFIFMLNVLLFFINYYYSYIFGYMVCSFTMGVLTWNFTGTLVHDHGGHRVNVKKNNRWGNLLMSFLNIITFPAGFETHFITSHYGHHSNIHDKDLDADDHFMYPLMRWSKNKKLLWFHKYQYIYYPFVYVFYLFSYYANINLDISNENWYNKNNHFRSVNKKFYCLLLIVLFGHFFIPLYNLEFMLGIRQIMIFILTYSFGAVLFATSSHLLNLESNYPNGDDWAYHTVSTSGDYLVNDFLASYISGGFNVHGLHHLFPSIHPSHLGSIYHIYEKKCREFKYPLIKTNTWKDFFQKITSNLFILGNE